MTTQTLSHFALRFVLTIFLLATSGCALKVGPTPAPVTIRFAYRQSLMDPKPLIAAFNAKYPTITVELLAIDRFSGNMATTLQGGKVDVFRESRDALGLAEQGLLRQLDDLQLDQWASIRKDYYAGTWEGLAVKGVQWGIPAAMDKSVVYVQDDYLKILNIKAPQVGWSLFDFLDVSTKLNYPEGVPNIGTNLIGCCTTPESIDPVIFVYLHGGKIVDSIENPTRATLNDPLTVEAVQWYADLFTRHMVAPDPAVVRQKFPQGGIYEAPFHGVCGVWIGNYSGRGGLDTPYKWSFKWRMLPLPRDKGEFSIGNLEAYYLTKSSAHPAEALKFIRFLSDRLEASGQGIPPRRSLVESPAYTKAVGDEAAAIAKAGSDKLVIIPLSASVLERVGGTFIQAVTRIVNDGTPAGPTLEEAQNTCKAFFQSP
jgi:ABC-type glycerol-3-phosphate transport system substrate-binding protein